jgi:hypothetical protein
MSKDTANIMNPAFSLARSMLDEMDQQAERFIQLSSGQATETASLLRTMRAQASGLQRTMLSTVEQLTTDALEAASQWQKTFGRGVA